MYTKENVRGEGSAERPGGTYEERRTMWEGINLGVFALISVDPAKARERVLSVDVHGTRATDTLAT